MKLRSFHVFNVVFFNLILIFLIEIGFRTFFPVPEVYLNKSEFPFESYPSNSRDYFDPAQTSHGQEYYTISRGPEEHMEDRSWKSTESPIILAVGDSFVYGQGVRYQDTFIKVLENLKPNISGVNAGVSGADLPEITSNFENLIKTVSPKLVLYGLNYNDLYIDPEVTSNFQHLDKRPKGTVVNDARQFWDFINLRNSFIFQEQNHSWLLNNFWIFNYYRYYSRLKSVTENSISHYKDLLNVQKNKKGLRRSIDAILSMQRICQSRGIEFKVIVFPLFYWPHGTYPFKSEHELLKEILADSQIEFMDPLPEFMRYRDKQLWVHSVDQHPNELAHHILADLLSKKILSEAER